MKLKCFPLYMMCLWQKSCFSPFFLVSRVESILFLDENGEIDSTSTQHKKLSQWKFSSNLIWRIACWKCLSTQKRDDFYIFYFILVSTMFPLLRIQSSSKKNVCTDVVNKSVKWKKSFLIQFYEPLWSEQKTKIYWSKIYAWHQRYHHANKF